VRVTFAIGEGVVASVVSDPRGRRSFDGQASGDCQRDPQRPRGLERAVSEVTVESDGDTGYGDQVSADRHDDVQLR
jgi:hypothetical protein